MENLHYLKFRRQFLLTPLKCNLLSEWQLIKTGSYYVYVHPDCELNKIEQSSTTFILIGYALNPHNPKQSSSQILKDLSTIKQINEIPQKLYSLSGRYVLLINTNNTLTLFNDPCGLRQVYYYKGENSFIAASTPNLINLVHPLKKNSNYYEYYHSQFYRTKVEHWLPSGTSFFNNTFHLIPNHYITSSESKQIRYFPNTKLHETTLEDAVKKLSFLLKNTIIAAKHRWSLALFLTSGLDTRTLLSFCHDFIKDIPTITLKYRNMSDISSDIKIANTLSSALNFNHHIIDCNQPSDKIFEKIYRSNSHLNHFNDWGIIANVLLNKFPKNHVAIKGTCTEIARCVYYRLGKTIPHTANKLIISEEGWEKLSFITNLLTNWYHSTVNTLDRYNYNLWDIFYWEHRCGQWQGQSQLEWNIAIEEFTPFNNREIIDTMLSVNSKYRCTPNFILFRRLIEKHWKELLDYPINPANKQAIIKNKLKHSLIYYNIIHTRL